MPRFLAVSVAWLLTIFCCFAQQRDSMPVFKPERLSNDVMIKFAPLSVLDADGGLNFSVEYLFAKQHIGLQMEAQPVLFSIQGDAGASGLSKPRNILQSGPVHGFKQRSEIRYYFDGLKQSRYPNSSRNGPQASRRLPVRTYLAAAFMHKQTQQQRTNEFYIYRDGTQPGYQLQAEYTDVKQITQFEVKCGVLKPLCNKHWLADIYFGAGIRVRKLFYQNLPAGALEPDRGGSLLGGAGTQSETLPAFPFGIRLVYRL